MPPMAHHAIAGTSSQGTNRRQNRPRVSVQECRRASQKGILARITPVQGVGAAHRDRADEGGGAGHPGQQATAACPDGEPHDCAEDDGRDGDDPAEDRR